METEDLAWKVMSVLGEELLVGFAYTFGLSREFGHPEVIVFGLGPAAMMGAFLNQVGRRVAAGERFEHGSVKRGLLPGATCRFARFPRDAHAEHLGRGMLELGVDRVDAVQCIWPDRRGRLPWDPRVNLRVPASQPVFLRPDAGARDPRWRFEAPPSMRALTTRQVVRGEEPIRFAGRFADGVYQFTCETTARDRDAVMTTLGWVVDHDPGLVRAATIAPGQAILRAEPGARWKAVSDWDGGE
ncbi:MAG: DUF4262 domain-containing protein [Polyangiaceae bacterium]|nr:DUF4262 domain-containing protein [Polyangiaceae bacterium]